MSVDVNTYVLYGIILPYAKCKAHYDELEPYFDHPKDGLTVIYDGMCGKYVAIGHVAAKTDDNQGFDEPVSIGKAPSGIGCKIWDLLRKIEISETEQRPLKCGWHVISNWS